LILIEYSGNKKNGASFVSSGPKITLFPPETVLIGAPFLRPENVMLVRKPMRWLMDKPQSARLCKDILVWRAFSSILLEDAIG
jgi:hypothetical protein